MAMFAWRRPVALVGARVHTERGLVGSLRFGTRVLGLDEPPRSGDEVVDLDGAVVLPGLINAHDHLELNHYGTMRPGERYGNVYEWIDDLRPIIRQDPRVVGASRQPLPARMFIGGLKNLLAGVTTVAHHNPVYRGAARALPVRLVTRFGWAHSLGMEHERVGANGEPGGDVARRYRATAPHLPFIVHAGEGVDARAAGELPRLQAMRCVRANTVMVHGVAWTLNDWARVVKTGAGLVWCPSSNLLLFGRTAAVAQFLQEVSGAEDRICLGTDSRLTGARDLLDEMRVAATCGVDAATLLRMVTTAPARMLRLHAGGRLRVGEPADLVVLPAAGATAAEAVLQASRRDVRLVVIGGRPMLGATRLAGVFSARRVRTGVLCVDGQPRLASVAVVRTLAACPIPEPGVSAGAVG